MVCPQKVGIMIKLFAALTLLLLSMPLAQADVRLAALFADHMVLQRDQANLVWGWADPGESVTVRFNGGAYTATTGEQGAWSVQVPPAPLGDPHALVVEGKNTITINDILMGDVWLCSGQSNMGWPVNKSNDAEKEIAVANYPEIRYFRVALGVALTEQSDTKGAWHVTTPDVAKWYSAVAYYFGREIHQELDVPIGLLATAWGGTPVESWTSQRAKERSETFKKLNDDWAADLAKQGDAMALYYNVRGKDRIERPETKRGLGNAPNVPSFNYNAMVAPLWRFGIKGAIWYQGESNAGRAYQYRDLMQTMILDWRSQFGQGNFPFIITEIANFGARVKEPGDSEWAELREAQSMATALPKVGIASIIEIGEADNIHPGNKQDVGYRLAQSALSIAYGKDVLPAGPTYAGMKIKGDKIVIGFNHVGGGLTTWNRESDEKTSSDSRVEPPISGFAIAGADQKFHWADATIKGEKVVLSSEHVKNPVAVRYGWSDNPVCNLYNTQNWILANYKLPHLPASPFRTDDFPMVTRDRW
jgi:sialate O-acetylesterase